MTNNTSYWWGDTRISFNEEKSHYQKWIGPRRGEKRSFSSMKKANRCRFKKEIHICGTSQDSIYTTI